ncbi:alpha/beta hydrolase family protein [Paraglaciecola sp. 2405UD69-4]|uniref:alpha/beta hydrolase family protein n=1 Tax=Paraglaciecola sp. 2405UD69-4 TaxID=3391836 RepID=UPI0039C8C6D4
MASIFQNTLASLTLVLASSLAVAATPLVIFPKAENNLAYTEVAQLPFAQADAKITYGSEPLQYALLWKAKGAMQVANRPLIVLIHGGCWLSAYNIEHTYAMSTGLAQAGFNVWSLEYRRTGDLGGGWPSTYDDIKAGILASAQYKDGEFDLANTVLVGHSAGGHLAMLAGGVMEELKGVIGLAAITDIEEYAYGSNSCQKVTKDFMQGMPKDKPHQYTLANPSKQPLHINSYILQGTKDDIVPAFNLKKLNRTVIMLDGVGHFDWIHPGSKAFKTLTFYLGELSK